MLSVIFLQPPNGDLALMGQLFGNLARYNGEQTGLGHLANYPSSLGQDESTNQFVLGFSFWTLKIFSKIFSTVSASR